MRIAIIGSRGVPARYGGFETLADRLSLYLVERGHSVTIVGENHVGSHTDSRRNLRCTLFSKRRFPVLFYFESVLRTLIGFEAVIILGVGGGPFQWLFHLTRVRVVTNVDGLEHLRDKYSALQKSYVRWSQYFAKKFSDQLVADAAAVEEYWIKTIRADQHRITVITYGTDIARIADDQLLKKFGLEKKNYYLLIARIVPENNIKMIVDSFLTADSLRKLVIVGNWQDSAYGREIRKWDDERLCLFDPVYDEEVVVALRRHSFAYLHGHSVGGTNPTLVEALGCGCITICFDNPFNRATTHGFGYFFHDKKSLKQEIEKVEVLSAAAIAELEMQSWLLAERVYDWRIIGNAYEKLLC